MFFLKENKSIQITAPLGPTIKSDLEEQKDARLVIEPSGVREERGGQKFSFRPLPSAVLQ